MADLVPTDPNTDQAKAETPQAENPVPTETVNAELPTPAEAENPTEQPAENEAAAEPAAAAPAAPPKVVKPLPKRTFFIIGGLFIVGLSALFAFILANGSQSKTTTTNTTNQAIIKPTLIPENTSGKSDINNPEAFAKLFVYGAWSGNTSLIKAVELSTQKTTVLASLPNSIKKVTVLSAQKLIYVDQTDKRDHGRQLVIYDLKTKAPQINIPASGGFAIDDYVISPDKKYIAVWEVSFAPQTEILQGGRSRVYSVDLAHPKVKHLLYDEKATQTTPVHYPRAITNNGRVFTDKFLPNDPKGGAGWAYGLSVIDFDGSNAQDLPQMLAGTYGTQPSLSPDGKYLLFAGYDGSKGPGITQANGYRQAIVTPNTVELLETDSLTRKKFALFENSNTYSSVEWDHSSGKIIVTIVSADETKTGVYTYDLQSQEFKKLIIPSAQSITYGFLTQLTPNMAIIGNKDSTPSNLGNLGETYAYPFTQVALYDIASSKVSIVPLEDTFAQFITILPGNYFSKVLGIQANAQTVPLPSFVDFQTEQTDPKAGQQMFTFVLKNDLESTRLRQQSTTQDNNTPDCKDLVSEQCKAKGLAENSSAYKSCVKTTKESNALAKNSGICYASPLYLYGDPGTQVDVTIQTPVSQAVPTYNNGYRVTLADNGKLIINDSTYSSIVYDYVPNIRRVPAPERGVIVKRSNLGNVLRSFAQKFGLNSKETSDLINAGKAKTVADYVFVSFYDRQTSEQILPISFEPVPDNYLNVVFYFRNLPDKPNYTPLPPVFEAPISRVGFTAVEISEIVE